MESIPAGITLEKLLVFKGLQPNYIATAINQEVIPASLWPHKILLEGDQLDILHPVGGG